jgi:putative cell wall-binding protein
MHRAIRIAWGVVAASIAVALLPSSALAISRDLVLSRGNVWANHVQSVDPKTGKKTYGVPYSQSRWALENGTLLPTATANPSSKGYRTDCSGFVSMCWNLRDSSGNPYSTTTADMGAKGSKKYFEITKAQLQPGDAILKSTDWGAPVGHVILFCGWTDSSQKSYWALEQTSSSSHNGTIYHTRPWGEQYYRPYRYSCLEDMYSDVEESVSAPDAYRAAAAASASTFKGTGGTVVIANGCQQGDQVVAASLAGAVHGPVLLTATASLPASTTAELVRLKPKLVYILGPTTSISSAVQSQIASICPSISRIVGKNSFVIAANALSTILAEGKARSGKAADTVYVASADEYAEALAIAPVAARTNRPVLFVHSKSVPDIDITKLKATRVRKVIVLGTKKSISTAIETAFKSKAKCKVSRICGGDVYKTAVAIVNHAIDLKIGFGYSRLGLASPASCTDALASASANGQTGSLVLLTPTKSLDVGPKRVFVAHRTVVGKARVFGGSSAVSAAARKALAAAMRSGK